MKNLALITCALLLLSACKKEEVQLSNINTDSFDPSFALPIGNVKLDLGRLNVRANRILQVNPTTGVLEFVYSSEILNQGFNDFNTLTNQNFSTFQNMSAAQMAAFNVLPNGSNYTFSASNTSTISVTNGEQLDSIILNGGSLDLSISSTFTHSATIVISIPSLTLNGVALTQTVPVNYTSTTPVVNNVSIPLAGYTLDLSQGGTTFNSLQVNYGINLVKGSSTSNSAQGITFGSNFTFSNVKEIHGYFGTRSVSILDSVEFDLFNNQFTNNIGLADPRIEMTIFNSTGVDFRANVNSISSPDNTIFPTLGGPGLSSIPTILGAANVGDSTVTAHFINNQNTSPTMTDFMSEKPGKLVFNAGMDLNPFGVTNNFISNNSRLRVDAKLILPLYGYATGFSLSDTMATSLESAIGLDSATAENLKQATLRLIVTNSLPLEADVQLYFLDSNNVVLDSLFSNGSEFIFAPGVVDFVLPSTRMNYGTVISPSKKSTDISLSKEKYQKLVANKQSKIVYQVKASTIGGATNSNVKFLSTNFVDIKLSAKVDLTVSF